MLVKTPAIKLGVEVRDTRIDGDKLVLTGVANAMPCTVEIGDKELVQLAKRFMKPAVIKLALKGLFKKED